MNIDVVWEVEYVGGRPGPLTENYNGENTGNEHTQEERPCELRRLV